MKKIVLCALIALTASPAIAADTSPQCPKRLTVTQTPADLPKDFEAYMDGNPPQPLKTEPLSLPLQAVLFWMGPPAEQELQAPTTTSKAALTWKFDHGQGKDVWMGCTYNATAVMIVTKLPSSVTGCRVTLEKDGETASGLTCR